MSKPFIKQAFRIFLIVLIFFIILLPLFAKEGENIWDVLRKIKNYVQGWNRIEREWELASWNSGYMQVVLKAKKSEIELHNIANLAMVEVNRLDGIINEYKDSSEAGKLRKYLENGEKNIQVSDELIKLLNYGIEISKHSKGALDRKSVV